ncbi:N-acetylmuramoyl-L-alanine amidase family protein [Sphingobacterium hungaricum]|uniref:N-acetylmuramoyl-L-alanine amidase n=1 Tax=Sphingobacterium hungaricum TaxID=2082723 RepID=A0A928YP48_9SPHI|nr:N-acetylmuramoyl-L-alanine amidase [Sphingobacterium hungaricum]MBE8712736.1 N-acetylmuramoyl-L-alanine amidase [Sphingobacterium hungaricum]
MKLKKNVKNLLVILTVIPSLIFLTSFITKKTNSNPNLSDLPSKVDDSNQKSFIVVIDPGHGGNKPGARGRQSLEKDIVLDVALKLRTQLEKDLPNTKVLLTRTTDVDVDFHVRTDVANKNHADLFISIHANSADSDIRVKNSKGRYVNQVKRNPSVKGTETFVCGYSRLGQQDVAIRENADILLEENYKENYGGFDPNDPSSYIVFSLLKRQFRNQSIKLATYMQNEYVKSNRGNRGVQEQSLAVLAYAGMPAVLTEIGFISSPDEEEYMLSSNGQKEIVNNLYEAIKTYKTSSGK